MRFESLSVVLFGHRFIPFNNCGGLRQTEDLIDVFVWHKFILRAYRCELYAFVCEYVNSA